MQKYKILKTFRDDTTGKWYSEGEVKELKSEDAGRFVSFGGIAPVIDTTGSIFAEKVETATDKTVTETATDKTVTTMSTQETGAPLSSLLPDDTDKGKKK